MDKALTGKERSAWVSLHYWRQGGRGKWLAAGVCAGAGAVWMVVCFARGSWHAPASPGPVHAVHAAWENDCAACHPGFLTPATDRNGLRRWLGDRDSADGLCQECHLGPPHHADREPAGDVPGCAGCHLDHQGRTAALARPADQACTRCHQHLPAHTRDGTGYGDDRDQIAHFTSHPEFRLGSKGKREVLGEANDPGKLKFNHRLHLTPGQKYDPKDRGGWTLGQVPSELRARYRAMQPEDRRKDTDLVELKCASCHQLDATDSPAAGPGVNVPLARASGDYVLPVTYDQHCKACHPLTFNPSLPKVSVPHHLQPADVGRFLTGVYVAELVKDADLAKKLTSGRPLPKVNVSREEKEARARVAGHVGRAEQYLYAGKSTCGLCHHFERGPGERLPRRIVPTAVPQVWYPHAKFSHRAHRAVDCLQCHEKATTSIVSTDVLLPGVENCQKCHSPDRGGVRHDCVTCHQYHHAAEPLAGLGAAARGVNERKAIEEFLRGKR
jgi:hypothetical protein